MGIICFGKAVTFHDAGDGEATLLRTTDGSYVSLNRIATVLVQTALISETEDAAISALLTCIDASEHELRAALHDALGRLSAGKWIIYPLDPAVAHHTDLASAYYPGASERIADAHTMPDQRSDEKALEGFDLHDSTPLSYWDGSWEIFLDGMLQHPPLPALSLLDRGRALLSTSAFLLQVRGIRLLGSLGGPRLRARANAWEWRCIKQGLTHPVCAQTERLRDLTPETWARLARRELLIARLLIHVLLPGGLCVERSIAFCRYMRALDWPAQMIIGRSRFGKADRFAFHAWVELAGIVVNDLAELQTGYLELQRIPSEAEISRASCSAPRSRRGIAVIGGIIALLLIVARLVLAIRKERKGN